MTTYTFDGFAVFRDPTSDLVTDIDPSTPLEVVFPDSVSAINYSLDPLPPGGTIDDQTVDIGPDPLDVRIEGVSPTETNDEASIYEVSWTEGGVPRTTIVLVLFFPDQTTAAGPRDVDFIYVIGGDPIPAISTPPQWAAFEGTITGLAVPGGAFAPGVDIPLSSLSNVTSSENDLINGTDGPDTIDGGAGKDEINGLGDNDVLRGQAGNDTLRGNGGNDQIDGGNGNDKIFGGNGQDVLLGGAGNDFISTGENGVGSFDYVQAGAGIDKVILTGVLQGFAQIDHRDLSSRVVVTIDGDANTGSVGKGSNGTTRFTDVANPLRGDGLGLIGTDFDDIFEVAPGTGGFMIVRPHSGDDRIKINPSDGFVRLDYRDDAAVNGIVADLAARRVTNDGFGDTDRIAGQGQVNELRATMMSDDVTGSDADERFILMAGTDELDAGGGSDLVRYDRSGVGAVTADLSSDTATGVWSGVAFTHTLINVENLRGSRDAGDTLAGSAGVNHLDGRGGDDLLQGRAGNDVLLGDDGDDTLEGGIGLDDLFGGDGDDLLIGGGQGDLLDGGAGIDTASYADAKIKLLANLVDASKNTGWALGDTYNSIENLIGGSKNDRLQGTSADNRLDGGAGNDNLEGRGGSDVLVGRSGNDKLNGGRGDDTMTGGGGNDQFTFNLGMDEVTDFTTGDSLRFDEALWAGTLSNAEILDFATVSGGDTIFDFGGGNILTLTDWTDKAALEAVITTF
jgi:Ca2+-binding RTX toxin-like protein